jgi:hypothetical protein
MDMISLLQFSVKIDSQGLLVIAFVTVYVVYSEIWGRHNNLYACGVFLDGTLREKFEQSFLLCLEFLALVF